jgi:preprotein translocase subunit SecD
MKRTRGLWISIAFVLALVAASLAALMAGTRPVLGLDLEGGVSVILSAPDGTPSEVMDRALENIRKRIDAFGTAEPTLFVTGNTIEVQIPGLARGTIDERVKEQYCLVGEGSERFGCFSTEGDGQAQLNAIVVTPLVQSVCLTGDVFGTSAPCFGTAKDAQAAIDAIAVQQSTDPATTGQFCLTGTGLGTDPCFPTKKEAAAALAGIDTATTQTWCLQGKDDTTLASDLGAACLPTQEEAQATLDAIALRASDSQFCVVSSAGVNLGCFLSRELAQAKLQETGQERLLQVIGTTARLEERAVIATLTPTSPDYVATPVTCGTATEKESSACSFEALKGKDVVFYGRDGQTKYQLGHVEITGDAIKKATALYDTNGQTCGTPGWCIDFTLTTEGADTFGQVTADMVGQQLAIVVDQEVISAPTVQDAITTGNGVITGSFTAQRAKDLATQLNAGALPVNLTTEQVVTVSPTLGKESLQQGLIAGLAGLLLLMLYLLFYYRLLAVVAWIGMTIWAILAIALVAVAGRTIGYSLTLAGVAGLVISLGVTADSYIVFFERLKDEVRSGRTPRAAVQPAFNRAYKTIVAADIVTGLAAIVLYLTAISSVRGFALTLGVATALDLFVVYFFKRPTVFLIARNERLVSMRGFGLTSGVSADHAPHAAAPAIAGGSG